LVSEEPAHSQAALRVALGEWLVRSGFGESLVGETIVSLGADGQTARTQVALRSADSVVVHDQRWQRGMSGWILVADREGSLQK